MSKPQRISSLKLERLRLALTLDEVAEATGIPKSTLSKIENGLIMGVKKTDARVLYEYYDGMVPHGEIYDPFYPQATGKISD